MKEIDYSIPDNLDLGDVVNAPVGSEIAVIQRIRSAGDRFRVSPCIKFVAKDEGRRLLLKNHPAEERINGAIVKSQNGASPYFLSSKCFYYSANPAHVALAKKKTKAVARRQAKRKAVRDAKLICATPIGELLGDGCAYDSYGDEYTSTAIAQEIADRLTVEQMNQLAAWLGITNQK